MNINKSVPLLKNKRVWKNLLLDALIVVAVSYQ